MAKERPLKRVLIREEFVVLTGDYREALILGQMEYWARRCDEYDAMLEEERQRAAGYNTAFDAPPTAGWIYKSADNLAQELMTGWSSQTTLKYLDSLVQKGFLFRRRNPKYAYDRIYQYRFNLKKVHDDLVKLGYYLQEWRLPSSEEESPSDKNGTVSDKKGRAIPEITPETTYLLCPSDMMTPNGASSNEQKESPLSSNGGIPTLEECYEEPIPVLQHTRPKCKAPRYVEPSQAQLDHRALCEAIIQVCRISETYSGVTGKAARNLREHDITPAQVIRWFGVDGWWYYQDWRGKQGQSPRPELIQKHWPQALADCGE